MTGMIQPVRSRRRAAQEQPGKTRERGRGAAIQSQLAGVLFMEL